MNPALFLATLDDFLFDFVITEFDNRLEQYGRWSNVLEGVKWYFDLMRINYKPFYLRCQADVNSFARSFDEFVNARGPANLGLHMFCLLSLTTLRKSVEKELVLLCVEQLGSPDRDLCFGDYKELFHLTNEPPPLYCSFVYRPLRYFFFMPLDYFVHFDGDQMAEFNFIV